MYSLDIQTNKYSKDNQVNVVMTIILNECKIEWNWIKGYNISDQTECRYFDQAKRTNSTKWQQVYTRSLDPLMWHLKIKWIL